jgi:hypothetical protein
MRTIFLTLFLVTACSKSVPPVPPKKEIVVKSEPQIEVNVGEAVVEETAPEEESNCSGLIEEFTVATVNNHKLKLNGKFAIGSTAGGVFIPLIYFHSLEKAMECENDADIRKWRNGHWAMIERDLE